jgi:hypothetical protein
MSRMVALLVILMSGVLACGNGLAVVGGSQSNPGTTAGSYIVTVTGTSGSSTATGTIALTVVP